MSDMHMNPLKKKKYFYGWSATTPPYTMKIRIDISLSKLNVTISWQTYKYLRNKYYKSIKNEYYKSVDIITGQNRKDTGFIHLIQLQCTIFFILQYFIMFYYFGIKSYWHNLSHTKTHLLK